MKRDYIKPEAIIVCLRFSSTLMQDLEDLDWGSTGEHSDSGWGGAKEGDFSTDETEDIWGMETKDVWER